MDTIRKSFSTEITDDQPDQRRLKFTISTDAVDRDGDILAASGWLLGSYLKNPVVMWAHDYQTMPIAKTVSIRRTEHGLVATAEFPPPGVHGFADTVFAMARGGFIGASSVGFKPISWEPFNGGKRYTQQELTEWSLCSIPSNPSAVIQRSVTLRNSSRQEPPMYEDATRFKRQLTTDICTAVTRAFRESWPQLQGPMTAAILDSIPAPRKTVHDDYRYQAACRANAKTMADTNAWYAARTAPVKR